MKIPWYQLQRLHAEGARKNIQNLRIGYGKGNEEILLDLRDSLLVLSEALIAIFYYIQSSELKKGGGETPELESWGGL